jgi:hypothetical protein
MVVLDEAITADKYIEKVQQFYCSFINEKADETHGFICFKHYKLNLLLSFQYHGNTLASCRANRNQSAT